MINILPENGINKEYTINIIPASDASTTRNRTSCFSRTISKTCFFKKRLDSPTVVMIFQKIKAAPKAFSSQNQDKTINSALYSSNEYDDNEPIYCTINEVKEYMKVDKCSNKKENDYIVMYNFSELSKKNIEESRQNDVVRKQEDDYVEMLNPYINLRSLQQQKTNSNENIESLNVLDSSDYIDDEHIYETI